MPAPAVPSYSEHNALSRKVEADAGGASLVILMAFSEVARDVEMSSVHDPEEGNEQCASCAPAAGGGLPVARAI